MRYVIDEDICAKHGLDISEVFGILFSYTCNNIPQKLFEMCDKEYLYKHENDLIPTEHYYDEVCSIMLESDKTVPIKSRCETLATSLRELFPKGIKTGSSAWRGNNREITLRLQKFFKLYGNKWSDEEIIAATKRYIEGFNGNYTYMRILKYFIMKSEKKLSEDGNYVVEEISELATYLENDTTETFNEDWTTEMR